MCRWLKNGDRNRKMAKLYFRISIISTIIKDTRYWIIDRQSQFLVILLNFQEKKKKAYKVDGKPMKTNEQMDVAEFFAQLFDKLESILKGSDQEKLLQIFLEITNAFAMVVNQK